MNQMCVVIFFLLTSLNTWALERSISSEDICNEIKGVKEFIMCALKVHPEIQESSADKARANGLLKEARRFPNPEIEVGLSQTDNIGQSSDTVDFKLMLPIEVGGKRGARIKQSKAESLLIDSEILNTKEKVVIETLMDLYRFRQISYEIELTNESLATFRNVKRQYSQRGSLGPQQAISLDIISFAEADYSLRKSSLESKKENLKRQLSIAIGKRFSGDKIVIPELITDWPILSNSTELKGSKIKMLRAKRQVAEGDYDVAKSEAWPDIAVGPTYSSETENNDRITTVGISIAMPLPIFNLNGGNKAVALAEKQKAIIHESNEEKNLKIVRENLVGLYNSITERIKKINPQKFEANIHERINKYLKRGVIEAPLVIESHRQIVDFLTHAHEHELDALSALWQIRALDGDLLKEIENIKTPE